MTIRNAIKCRFYKNCEYVSGRCLEKDYIQQCHLKIPPYANPFNNIIIEEAEEPSGLVLKLEKSDSKNGNS